MMPDKVLVDTGASWHMVSRKAVHPKVLLTARKLKIPITLATANGDVQVSATVHLRPPGFKHDVEALLLDDTPTVVSVGKFCMEYGYGFYWNPKQLPFLLSPKGEVIEFTVENNVPYWPEPGGQKGSAESALAGAKRPSDWDSLLTDQWQTKHRTIANIDWMVFSLHTPKTRVYRTIGEEFNPPAWKQVHKVITYEFDTGKRLREVNIDHSKPIDWDTMHGPITEDGSAANIVTELWCRLIDATRKDAVEETPKTSSSGARSSKDRAGKPGGKRKAKPPPSSDDLIECQPCGPPLTPEPGE